jgi:hypothetical protein
VPIVFNISPETIITEIECIGNESIDSNPNATTLNCAATEDIVAG